MITIININEKTEKNNVKNIFKNEVKLIINKKAFILKFMIIK